MLDWEFRDPWLLLAALLVPVVYRVWSRPRAVVEFPSVELISRAPKSLRVQLAVVAPASLAFGLLMCVVALARPQTPDAQTRVSREGIAMLMVIDRSGSMNARDLVKDDRSVDRLSVVKQVLESFVLGSDQTAGRGRPDDMIGLVTFAGYADSVCPLTLDHPNLVNMVRELEIAASQAEDGTALGDGLALAVERLRQSPAESKVIILLTDGVQNAGVITPEQATKLAKEYGVRVYCVGAGTNGLAPFPVHNPFTGRPEWRPVRVEIDEDTMKNIAEETGGQYFRATDQQAMEQIYGQIDALERTEVTEIRYLNYTEHYGFFVLAGLTMTGVSLVLTQTLFKRQP